MDIRSFTDQDLAAAGQLLAARHAAHRRREPLLPAQYEDAASAQEQVEALWARDGASAAVAVEAGQVVGYLIGTRRPGDTWGESTWVELASTRPARRSSRRVRCRRWTSSWRSGSRRCRTSGS